MSIIDKANEYIGHPREVDEGYEVSMRRTAYAQGYQDAIDKACKWLLNIDFDGQEFRDCDESFNNDLFVDAFRKAMEK